MHRYLENGVRYDKRYVMNSASLYFGIVIINII